MKEKYKLTNEPFVTNTWGIIWTKRWKNDAATNEKRTEKKI